MQKKTRPGPGSWDRSQTPVKPPPLGLGSYQTAAVALAALAAGAFKGLGKIFVLTTVVSDATESKLEQEELGTTFNSTTSNQPPEDDDDDEQSSGKQQKERRKIEIKFIQDKSRRHITFSKRKAGIMKKAYELSVLTGTQVLLLVVSETGLVYTFTTPKLQPLVTKSEGKNLIQACLNAPEDGLGDDQDNQSEANSPESGTEQSPAHHQQQGPAPGHQQGPPQPVGNHNHPMAPTQVQPAVGSNQLPPGAHLPPGMPYPQAHPQTMPMQPQGYNDPNVYQQYFNMQNGNMPNQQQYQ